MRGEDVPRIEDQVSADDITPSIDSRGTGEYGAGDVNGREGPLMEEKAMAAVGAKVAPDDVTPRVDTYGFGAQSAGELNGGEGPLVEEKTASVEGADDITPSIDSQGTGV